MMNTSEQRRIFSKNLRYYMHQNQKSQTDMANELHIAQQTVNSWCMGICIPRMDRLDAIAKYLGTDSESLLRPIFIKEDSATDQEHRIMDLIRQLTVSQMDFLESLLRTMVKGEEND